MSAPSRARRRAAGGRASDGQAACGAYPPGLLFAAAASVRGGPTDVTEPLSLDALAEETCAFDAALGALVGGGGGAPGSGAAAGAPLPVPVAPLLGLLPPRLLDVLDAERRTKEGEGAAGGGSGGGSGGGGTGEGRANDGGGVAEASDRGEREKRSGADAVPSALAGLGEEGAEGRSAPACTPSPSAVAAAPPPETPSQAPASSRSGTRSEAALSSLQMYRAALERATEEARRARARAAEALQLLRGAAGASGEALPGPNQPPPALPPPAGSTGLAAWSATPREDRLSPARDVVLTVSVSLPGRSKLAPERWAVLGSTTLDEFRGSFRCILDDHVIAAERGIRPGGKRARTDDRGARRGGEDEGLGERGGDGGGDEGPGERSGDGGGDEGSAGRGGDGGGDEERGEGRGAVGEDERRKGEREDGEDERGEGERGGGEGEEAERGGDGGFVRARLGSRSAPKSSRSVLRARGESPAPPSPAPRSSLPSPPASPAPPRPSLASPQFDPTAYLYCRGVFFETVPGSTLDLRRALAASGLPAPLHPLPTVASGAPAPVASGTEAGGAKRARGPGRRRARGGKGANEGRAAVADASAAAAEVARPRTRGSVRLLAQEPPHRPPSPPSAPSLSSPAPSSSSSAPSAPSAPASPPSSARSPRSPPSPTLSSPPSPRSPSPSPFPLPRAGGDRPSPDSAPPHFSSFSSAPLGGTPFRSLFSELGPGTALLLSHAGGCEHLVQLLDLRPFDPDLDPASRRRYPRRLSPAPQLHPRACEACASRDAAVATFGDRRADRSPFFWCRRCFERAHYDAEGRLRGAGEAEFRALPYLGEPLVTASGEPAAMQRRSRGGKGRDGKK